MSEGDLYLVIQVVVEVIPQQKVHELRLAFLVTAEGGGPQSSMEEAGWQWGDSRSLAMISLLGNHL